MPRGPDEVEPHAVTAPVRRAFEAGLEEAGEGLAETIAHGGDLYAKFVMVLAQSARVVNWLRHETKLARAALDRPPRPERRQRRARRRRPGRRARYRHRHPRRRRAACRALGEEQAEALGRWFAALPPRKGPRSSCPRLMSARSRPRRDLRAGRLVGGRGATIVDERLREREFGIFDRLTTAGIRQKFPD